MNAKLVLFGVGAAFVTSVAVPASLAKAKKGTDDETTTKEDRVFSEDQSIEETLDDQDKIIRKNLDKTERLVFDQFQKVNKRRISKKRKEIYPNYFLDSKGNRAEWNSKFSHIKTNYNITSDIVYDFGKDSGEPVVTISQAWSEDSSDTYNPSNISLNSFCKHKIDSLSGESLWILCSSFLEKPVSLAQEEEIQPLFNSATQIGPVFDMFLISPNGNDSFWSKRQEEWKNLESNNSAYFKYDSSKKIRDLCKDAYYKEVDETGNTTTDEILKHCSLEWDS